jgi:hypothetical protein
MNFLKTALILFLISFYSSFLLSNNKLSEKEYQLTIEQDSVTIYDGSRIVGTVPPDSIGALLINDNQ